MIPTAPPIAAAASTPGPGRTRSVCLPWLAMGLGLLAWVLGLSAAALVLRVLECRA